MKIYPIKLPAIPSAGVYYFTTDSGVEYEVRFGRKQNDLLNVSIVFGVRNDEYEGEEYSLTNKGEVYSVMATIIEVIKIYMSEHPNVRVYEFTGEPKEGEPLDKPTQRLRLYRRYVNRLFDHSEWEISQDVNKITVQKDLV